MAKSKVSENETVAIQNDAPVAQNETVNVIEADDESLSPVNGAPPANDPAAAMGLMAKVLERLVDRQEAGPIPQIPVTKALFPTPWHPSGTQTRPSLARTTFLNGHRLREIMMSDEEIHLCNALKAGRYHNRKWMVVDTDGDGNASSIQIYLPNKTEAERLELNSTARNLAEALTMIVEEAATRVSQ